MKNLVICDLFLIFASFFTKFTCLWVPLSPGSPWDLILTSLNMSACLKNESNTYFKKMWPMCVPNSANLFFCFIICMGVDSWYVYLYGGVLVVCVTSNPIKNIYEFLSSHSEVNPVQWPGYECHNRLESLRRYWLFQVGISFPPRYHLCPLSCFFFHWRVTEGLRMSDIPSPNIHSQCHTSLLTCRNTSWYVLVPSMQSFCKARPSYPLTP